MNVTFNLELNKNNASSKEATVLIRLTLNRKMKRISTGVSIPVNSWDNVNKKVKKNHPLAKEYNQIIDESLKKLVNAYGKLLQNRDDVTLNDITNAAFNFYNPTFFEFAYQTKMADIKASNKLGTYRRYEAVLSKFKTFAGPNLKINRVDYALLRKYEYYLLNNLKNGRDTVSSNLSVIRAIINEAIRYDVFREKNPFDQIQLRYTDNTKQKLTATELYKVFTTPLPDIPSLLLARDFFLACFLAEGIRGGDMMVMQKENIINGHLVYNQQKTGKKMVVFITSQLQEIFNRYESKGTFLFPFLNNSKIVNEFTINSKLTYVNKYLKEVCKYCGIFKKITTHCERHTFTDLALHISEGNIYEVQQSLGHSSVKTTEIYSRQRVNYQKGSLVPAIVGYIEKECT